jgi:hypothetical protein
MRRAPRGGHAVVIGASMAGLLAARALAEELGLAPRTTDHQMMTPLSSAAPLIRWRVAKH